MGSRMIDQFTRLKSLDDRGARITRNGEEARKGRSMIRKDCVDAVATVLGMVSRELDALNEFVLARFHAGGFPISLFARAEKA
jgi:hypothetical protein